MDILVVDDDPSLQTLMSFVLADVGNVRIVSDAAEAQRAIEVAMPDAVVLDVMLPGMTGTQLLAEWRADARTADLPVVLLTAMDRTEDRLAGAAAGADAYVTKPFDTELLCALLEHMVQDRQDIRAEFLRELSAL